MSDRLTNKWTDTLDEAFGETGTKGREGEEFLVEVLRSWGWDVEHHSDDRELQVQGIDVSFKSPKWQSSYTGDVKNNMDDFGSFYVYKEWLYKIKCDRVFHVNPKTGWIAYYGVPEMFEFYDDKYDRIKITPSNTPKFVTRRRYAR